MFLEIIVPQTRGEMEMLRRMRVDGLLVTPDTQERELVGMRALGGPGSGNFDHAGRPGQVGGSSPGNPDIKVPGSGVFARHKPGDIGTRVDAGNIGIGGVFPPQNDDELTPEVIDGLFKAAGLPDSVKTEDGAVSLFRTRLIGQELYHEAPGDISDSVRRDGLTGGEYGDTNFAAVGVDSDFVSSSVKTVVRFTAPQRDIVPDLIYGWSTKLTPEQMLLIQFPQVTGAYVAVNRNIRPRDIVNVEVRRARGLSSGETPIHHAADQHVAKFDVLFRYAFAAGRKAIKPMLKGDKVVATSVAARASSAIADALEVPLPKMVLAAAVSGGEAGASLLSRRLRAAGGPGSGNFGHAGRPGEVGGSGSRGTNSPAFKQWFGASKVVDANGNPLVVSHGSPHAGITEFDRLAPRSMPSKADRMDSVGTWFVEPQDRELVASKFIHGFDDKGKEITGEVYDSYLSLQNPKTYGTFKDLVKDFNEVVRPGQPWEFAGGGVAPNGGNVFHDKLVIAGYDGIIVSDPDGMDFRRGEKQTYFVAFHPWQIKPAKGELRGLEGPLVMKFDAKNPTVIEWAKRHAATLVTEVTRTTRDRIRNAVTGLQEDGDFDFAYDRILHAVGDEARAYLIARNETMLAAGEGQRLAWEQAEDQGLLSGKEKREWIVTPDERLCPICAELEGATAPLGGEYPGGFEGPPAHVQCRCTEGIVF